MNTEESIRRLIEEKLSPSHLEVKNQSHLHEGHTGHDGSGESHFQLTVVSQKFSGLSKIERHRMIYAILDSLFKDRIHALSLCAQTKEEQCAGD